MDNKEIIAEAEKHVHDHAQNTPSAEFCLAEAKRNQNPDSTKMWALKSLAYSVGIGSPVYKKCKGE